MSDLDLDALDEWAFEVGNESVLALIRRLRGEEDHYNAALMRRMRALERMSEAAAAAAKAIASYQRVGVRWGTVVKRGRALEAALAAVEEK